MRTFDEYKPELKEEISFKFNVLKSIKKNPFCWISFIILVVSVIAFSLNLSSVFEAKMIAKIDAINAEIEAQKTQINKKTEVIKQRLNSYGIPAENQAEMLSDITEFIAAYKPIDENAVKMAFDAAKEKGIIDNKSPIPDYFIVLSKIIDTEKANNQIILSSLSTINDRLDKVIYVTDIIDNALKETSTEEERNEAIAVIKKDRNGIRKINNLLRLNSAPQVINWQDSEVLNGFIFEKIKGGEDKPIIDRFIDNFTEKKQ